MEIDKQIASSTQTVHDLALKTIFSLYDLSKVKVDHGLTDFGLAIACERAIKYSMTLNDAADDVKQKIWFDTKTHVQFAKAQEFLNFLDASKLTAWK